MKVELLVSDWCHTCPAAEQVWRDVAIEKDIRFAVIDLAQPEGRGLAAQLRIRSIPATVIDDKLALVGVPTPEQARALVADAPPRERHRAYHTGMMLSRDNRAFIATAMTYLVLAAAWLGLHGDLMSGESGLPTGLHIFTTGFVLMLIYGTGAHMLPRFTGNPIRGGALLAAQFVCAQLGALVLMIGFFLGLRALAIAGGAFVLLGLTLYAIRVLPVLWPR